MKVIKTQQRFVAISQRTVATPNERRLKAKILTGGLKLWLLNLLSHGRS
ncbi:hypothetical protein [Flavobacterium sp.]